MSEAIQLQSLGPLTAARVGRVETALLQLPQVECPLVHRFAPGVCIREVRMPAGALVIGHAHRFADFNILLAGRLTLLLEDGSLKELSAPLTFVGTPGRKIAYIQEDVTWQNVWALRVQSPESRVWSPEWIELGTDVEAIEAYYLDKSPGWVADRARRLAVERLARQADRESFEAFLQTHGLPAEDERRISECEADQIPLLAGDWKFQVGNSAIEGKGLLATGDFAPGEIIAPMRIAGRRTPAGRYANHSQEPNAIVQMADLPSPDSQFRLLGNLELVARRSIRGCRGGQPGEEITVDYEQVLQANAASVLANVQPKGQI